MALETRSPAVLRFGTFEVNLRAGELRKQGVRIKLQEQPFHVLTVLLQRPGEVVTREELRSQNWPADTFVDFDNSLNTAINKLREALGDSADSPRFIETLPRRGYRFVAPVSSDDGKVSAIGAAAVSHTQRWKMAVQAVIVVVAVAAVAGGFFWRSRQTRKLTEKDTIVLADFANTTGDPLFDDTLKQALRVQLEQSPFLNVLSEQESSQELRLMERSPEQPLTSEVARDLCQRIGSKAVLAGSIASLGTHYAIGLNAFNCHTGTGLASEQVEADSKEHILRILGEATTRMRKSLGESLATIQKYDAPAERATTASLDALKAYSLAKKIGQMNGPPSAIPLLKRAVDLDPQFAMAYGRLGVAYSEIGDVAQSIKNAGKAFELRHRVSERERFYLEAHYYDLVTGEWEKAAQTYELWEQVYPRDPIPHDNLQGVYTSEGKHDEALAEALEALRLEPNTVAAYEDACTSYLHLSRISEAQEVLRRASQLKLQSGLLVWCRFQLAFLNGDADEMARAVASAAGGHAVVFLLDQQATREAQLGRLHRARDMWQRATESAKNQLPMEVVASFQDNAGLVEAYLGNPKQARNDVAMGQKLSDSRLGEPVAAFALALADDKKGAEKIDADLNKRWPRDSLVQSYWLPSIRAAVALNLQNPEKALELLQVMGSYDLSAEGQLDSVYLRGRAHLMLNNGIAAAADFQKIIGHPGLVLESPVGALAHLQLGRAYALQGDTAKARVAYNDFLTLWKDADADIPILKEAKAEYAKLQ